MKIGEDRFEGHAIFTLLSDRRNDLSAAVKEANNTSGMPGHETSSCPLLTGSQANIYFWTVKVGGAACAAPPREMGRSLYGGHGITN